MRRRLFNGMAKDGVTLHCCGKDVRVETISNGKRLVVESHGQRHEVIVDEIVVGTGCSPNVQGLGLRRSGRIDKAGVTVNERLQTTNPADLCRRRHLLTLQIYPRGGCDGADRHSKRPVPASFGLGYASTDSLNMPWCIYTTPEIAHVGLYEADAKQKGWRSKPIPIPSRRSIEPFLMGTRKGSPVCTFRKGPTRFWCNDCVGPMRET